MAEQIRVAAVGLACLDFLALARQAPVGETSRMHRLLVQGGGLTATAAVAAARLGAGVRLLTRVGDDDIGRQVLDELREEGVRLTGAPVVAGAATPCSVILVDPGTGDRTIYNFPGRGLEAEAAADVSFVRSSQALLVDAFWREAALAAAAAAREAGLPVVADFAPGAEVEELAGLVDVFIVPESWAGERCGAGGPSPRSASVGARHALPPPSAGSPRGFTPSAVEGESRGGCEEALELLHSYGARIAVVTAGGRGCWYSAGGERGHCKAFEVEVVDTTGAGDVFHGAFAYALARGWEVARCVEFSAAVAALKCGKLGGRTGIPTLPQTLEFLRANGRLDWRQA